MKQNAATRRLGEQLREKLGYILLFEIADRRLELVNITGVEVAVDRSFARVYVACEEGRYEEVLEALTAARGRIRSLLAHSLSWRVVPELEFKIDRTTDEAERIGRALENVPATMGVPKDEEGYPIEEEPDSAAAARPMEGAASFSESAVSPAPAPVEPSAQADDDHE